VLTSLIEPLHQNQFVVEAGTIGLGAAQSISEFGHNMAQV